MIGAEFLSGICMATFGAASIFFFKFWRASHDLFFLLFGVACALLSFERVALLLVRGVLGATDGSLTEADAWIYLMRLSAFVVILVAIVLKNRDAARRND